MRLLAPALYNTAAVKLFPFPQIFSVVDEYAPGFSESVVGFEVLPPPDLERVFGLTGGVRTWVLQCLFILLIYHSSFLLGFSVSIGCIYFYWICWFIYCLYLSLSQNIFQGAMSLDQLFVSRPSPLQVGPTTPVPGLLLCGAAAHPGGGVMGAPGRLAALAALRR